MQQANLINQCRYYKGEDKCPFSVGPLPWFWDMERVWVRHNGQFVGEKDTYEALGGKPNDAIPYSLLLVMFTSWAKCGYLTEQAIVEFNNTVIDEYLSIPDDHFPKDKIPKIR